ncbi:hypothetical protein BJY17_002184 [Agromyces hippuratus]|uniref:DUF5979 domain-containing protein n=1 Tax=Agromyces hippuratus TaxID=286438 RepID=A0A852WUU2_9MICO|nr:DUF5979 domain-containing protein [Agromyces hippuratus]NYG21437.1 hypothetical protein [Agromyces hippuratus]
MAEGEGEKMSIIRRTLAGVVAVVFAIGLTTPAVLPAVAAPDDAVFLLTKSVNPDTSPYEPGEQFSYTIELTCNSNLVDTCVGAELNDTLPAPLIFDPSVSPAVSVSGGGTSTAAVGPSDFTVDFTTQGGAGIGQPAGTKASITVFVQVPDDISADYNGASITNTASATGTNALSKDASATITLEVPEVLDSTVQKSVDDHQPDGAPGIPALPGQPVDYTIGGGNASNRSVDEIVVQDPADGVASPFDTYFDFTGITSITPPAGADQVSVEWLDADGVWHQDYSGAIPADTSGIPEVDPLSDVKGLRFTFSSTTGQLPPTPAGEEASIGIGAETNETVETIPRDQAVEVPNTASSNIVVHGDSSVPKTAPGDAVVSNTGPFVETTKSFANPNLLAGQQTTATITSTNGFRPVTSMVIQEPTPGSPDLGEQGLDFDGFTDGVVWPPNATGASVTYVYDDGTEETLTADAPNTLPDPTTEGVVGFTVTFTGPIIQNAAATLPFTVTAQPVDTEDVVSTNDTTTTVTDEVGLSGTDEDSADITRQPGRVSTTIEKNIARDEVWAVPGTTTDVSFLANVNDQQPNPSTIGSEVLIVSDPADPQPGDPVTPFWNTFDASQIVAGVPANADLQVQYWNGEEWVDLPGGQLDGEGDLVVTIPADLQDDIEGIRFVYTPKSGELLPPGFQVAPTITVETREDFRDGSGSVADAAEAANPLTVANTAGSEVENPNDTSPEDNTATDGDEIDLKPIDGGGPGPDLFEKHWIVDPAEPLFAFSGDRRTARISWSTEGLPFDSVVITDDPTAGPDYSDATIAQSTFDAWNLVEIAAIDSALDPTMQYDRIAAVELFNGDTGTWDDVTDAACGDGTACDGAFPGYTLSADEVASTRAVRLTYEEGSHRGDGTGPVEGSGVAPSYGHDRDLDLVFELRDFTRSDGGPVTGDLHPDETYNSGQAGVVRNTAQIVGTGVQPITETDADEITILDAAVNVEVTKAFDPAELPVPAPDTPQADYPLTTATITATNQTEAAVETLEVSDPAPGSATTAYDYLNLYSIDSITVPADATSSTVILTREGGADDAPISIDAALALTSGDLADVIGVTVRHTDPGGISILSTSSSTVLLTFQMRQMHRSAAVPIVVGDLATNVAGAEVTRPGGLPLDEAAGTSTATLPFVTATYGVAATKEITPESRYENEPRDGYTVALTGQPTGNVRTTVLTITDDEPTFWNAFEFASFPTATLPPNLHQLQVSALVGVEWTIQPVTNRLVYTCGGSADLTACWVPGDWQDAAADGTVLPVLPDGVDAADVRGLRFAVRVDDDLSNWENPVNPIVPISFTADRLEFLHYGPAGEVDSVPVPSTQPGQPLAPGEEVHGRTTDIVDVHGVGAWDEEGGTTWEADDVASDFTQLLHLQNAIKVEKTPGNGSDGAASQQFPPTGAIPYRMTVTNTGDWPMTGLELTDQVATDASGSLLVPQPGADPVFGFTLTAGDGTVLDASGFSGELDTATGVVTIAVPDGFVFEPGDVLVISAALQFRPGLAPGTPVGNTISATSDRTFDTCESTAFAQPVPATQVVDDCASNTTVNPSAAAPIALQKGVRGVGAGIPGAAPGDANYDDLGVLNTTDPDSADACAQPNALIPGFYLSNCVPITRPGGIERWAIAFTNLGNVPVESIGGIDVLPAIGDTGVTIGTNRGSEWSPVFLGNVTILDPTISFRSYYLTTVPATACNASDIEFSTRTTSMPTDDPCYGDVSTRDWIEFTDATPAAELAQARAIKVVVTWPDGRGLSPRASGGLTFDTQTPYSNPAAVDGGLPIAWNAVAAGSRAEFDAEEIYQGPVEPVRSGVAVPTGDIALEKEVVVPDDWPAEWPLPASYDFDVQCVSGGEPVSLVDGDGSPSSPVTVPADGTEVVFGEGTNLPMYSECTVQEIAAQGSTVTYDPAGADGRSGEVTARRDLTSRPDIHHPAPDGSELERVTVTNTYELGGFTVSKAVDNGGAENQSGDDIVYDTVYRFNASCVFDGETVFDVDFELTAGESLPFEPLPVGSVCTVEETDQAGADTSIVVTQDGVEDDRGDVTSAEFTVLPDDETGQSVTLVAVTNSYSVGSVEIVKSVTGTGADAWGGSFGDFEVRLVCTLPAADPDTVYDGTHTLTKDAPGDVWLVENLPTGAECDVTEIDDGGATASSVTPETPIIVGDASAEDPVRVDIDNEFRTGAVDVLKSMSGPGAGDFSEGEYVFEVVCTYEDTTVVDEELVVVSDGGDGPFRSRTITGIPVGAECVVTETDAGHADDPAAPVTVTIADQAEAGVETVVTAGFVNEFSLGTVELTKEADGEAADAEYVADAVFTVQLTCQVEVDGELVTLYDGAIEIAAGETIEVVDANGDPVHLPGGTHCFATETDAGGASSATVDFDSYENAAIVEASDTAQLLTITATNTFDNGGIELEKTVSGAVDQAAGKSFTIALTCVLDRGANDPYFALDAESVTITAGETKRFDELPVGAECWAEEVDAGGAVEVAVSATEANPVVVGDDEIVTITVDNRFAPPLPATGFDGDALAARLTWALLLTGGGLALVAFVVVRRRRSRAELRLGTR